MFNRLSRLLLIALIFLFLIDCLNFNVLGTLPTERLKEYGEWYLHDEASGIGSYQTWWINDPNNAAPAVINRTLNVGYYFVKGFISNSLPFSVTLKPPHNWLASLYVNKSVQARGFITVQIYGWRNGAEKLVFTMQAKPFETVCERAAHVWQSKDTKTYVIQENDRIICKLYLNVTNAGWFAFAYDNINYDSFVSDPTETRYMRSDTQTINGLLAYKLETSQSSSALSVSSTASSTSLYGTTIRPTSDVLAGFPTQYPASSYHYQKVDDVVADDTDTMVLTSVEDVTVYYDRYGHTAYGGASTIAYVKVTFRAMKSGVGSRKATFSGGIYINGVYYWTIGTGATNVWTTDSVIYYLNPNTNLPWTTTDISNLQLAIKGSSLYYLEAYYPAYCTQIYMEVYTYTDIDTIYSIDVVKRTSAGAETAIGTKVASTTHTLAYYFSNPGLDSGTWVCPQTALETTDSIVVRVYVKIGSGSWTLIREFTTAQLGALSLDSATWTVYYYLSVLVDASYMYSKFWHGTSTYNSRITNFVWTEAVTKSWHTIISWSFSLLTRQWTSIGTWALNLQTRQWNTISPWALSLFTRNWNPISTWNFNLLTRAWSYISSWTLNLTTMQWHSIIEWLLNLNTKQWNLITETIIFIETMTWQNITTWTFQIISLGWHTIADWFFKLIIPSVLPPFKPPTEITPQSPIPLLLIIPIAIAVALIVFSKR
jgi:hypothetical protein